MKFLIWILFLAIVSYSGIAQNSSISGLLGKGQYPVGFQQIRLDESVGPIRINLWYPAKNKSTIPVTLNDYLMTAYPKNLSDGTLSELITGDSLFLNHNNAEWVRNLTYLTTKNATPRKGKYPVILWSTREDTPLYHFPLIEFLAGHGFVVIHAMLEDEILPFPRELETPEEKMEVLQKHQSILEAAYTFLKSNKNSDHSKLLFLNWSYTFESGLLFVQRHLEIPYYVGLSSTAFDRGPFLGDKLALELHLNQFPANFIILREEADQLGKLILPPIQLNQLNSNSAFISYANVGHGNFNFIEGVLPVWLKSDKCRLWALCHSSADQEYQKICEDVLGIAETMAQRKAIQNVPLLKRKGIKVTTFFK